MHVDPTLDLACELIRRQSVTPLDDGCQQLMMARLTALGFHCTPLPFGDTLNFWAEWGDDGPLLAFAGHTDVVRLLQTPEQIPTIGASTASGPA